MLSPTSIETYFRSATARLYETLDVPPFYLVLHPLQAFRRQGIGAALTASVARAAFDRGVKVAFLVAENDRAAGVYRRAGFSAYATALAYGEA